MNRTLKTLRLKRSKKGMKGGTPTDASGPIMQMDSVTLGDTVDQDTVDQDTAGQDTAGLDTAGQDTAGQDTAGLDTAGPVYEYKCIYPGCNFYGNKENHNVHVNECEYNSRSLMNNYESTVTLDSWIRKTATLHFKKYKTPNGDKEISLFMVANRVPHKLLDGLSSSEDPKREAEGKILRLNYSWAKAFTAKSRTGNPKLILHFTDKHAKQKAMDWLTARVVWKSDSYTELPDYVTNNSITDDQLASKFRDAVGATLAKAKEAFNIAAKKAAAAVEAESNVLADPGEAAAASEATEKAEAVLIAATAARDEAQTNYATANEHLWMGPQDSSGNVLTNPNSDIKLMWDIHMRPIWIKSGIPLHSPTGEERLNIMGIQSPSDWKTWQNNYNIAETLKIHINETIEKLKHMESTVHDKYVLKEKFERINKGAFIQEYDMIKSGFKPESSDSGRVPNMWTMDVNPEIIFKLSETEQSRDYPYMGIAEFPDGGNVFETMVDTWLTYWEEQKIRDKEQSDAIGRYVW